MTDQSLQERGDRFLLALRKIRDEQHPELTEEERNAGLIQNELTVQTSKAKEILGFEDDHAFTEENAEIIPRLRQKGLVTDLHDPGTNGAVGGLKLTDFGLQQSDQLRHEKSL